MKLKLYIGQSETVQQEIGSVITFMNSPAIAGTDTISFDYYTNWPLTNSISTITTPLLAIPSPYTNAQMAQDFGSFLTGLHNNLTVEYNDGDDFITIIMDNGSPIFNYVFSDTFAFGVAHFEDVVVTNYTPFDLFQDETMELTSKLSDIEKLSNVFTDFTNSFTVPANDINNALFKHYYNIDIDNTFNANTRVLAYIEIDSLPLRYGKLQLESITLTNQRPDNYKVTFYGSLVQLSDLFGDDTIDKLDYKKNKYTKKYEKLWNSLSQFDFDYNEANILAAMTDPTFKDGNVMIPLIAYSNRDWNYLGADSSVDISTDAGAIRPDELITALRMIKIIEAIETKYGISFTRNFFGKAQFQNLFLWLNNKSVQTFTQGLDLNGFTSISDDMDNPTFLAEDYISFNYTDNYVQISLPAGGFEGTLPIYVLFKTDVYNTSNSITKYKIVVRNYDTNEIMNIGPELQGDVDPGYTNYFNLASKSTDYTIRLKFEVEVDGSLDFKFVNYIDLSLPTGSIVGMMSSENVQSVTFGQNVSNNITNMKVIDFFQGIMKAWKLIIRPITPTIFYVNTLDGYYGDGNILDITPYVDQTTVKIERPLIYRNLKFKYQKTENVLGKKFRQTYDPVNDDIGYGDLQATYETIDNKDELLVELPFENMLFERLTSGSTTTLTNILIGQAMTLSDNGDLAPNKGKPIMFYSNGLVDISNSPIKFKWPAGDDYNYHTLNNIKQVANTNDELLSQVTDCINWGAEIDPWHYTEIDNSLFENYWSNWINTIYDLKQRKFTYNATLPSRFVQELSLNDALIIGNQKYKINDYTINLTNGDTKLTLFKDIYDWNGYTYPEPYHNKDYKFGPNGWYTINTINEGNAALIYGYFNSYNTITNNSIIRLLEDGSVDPTFSAGTGFNAAYYASERPILQLDGKYMVVGSFTTYNGTSASHMIRLNHNGSIDSTFGTGLNNTAYGLTIDSNSNYLIGGSFSSYNGTSVPKLVKISSGGTIDSTFNTNIGTGPNNVVLDIVLNTNDSMYVSGYFTSFNGSACSHMIKLTSSGTVDPSFTNYGFTVGANQLVNMIDVGNGLVMFGQFIAYNSVSANRIVKLKYDGSIDTSFVYGTGFNSYNYQANKVLGDKLLIQGDFTSYNGFTSKNAIILNNDGSIYRTFDKSYLNIFSIGNKFYGNLLNGPTVMITDETLPTLSTSSIIMNSGTKYFGIDVLKNEAWTLTKHDTGDGVDWIDVLTTSDDGAGETIINIEDLSQTPSLYVSRRMLLVFDFNGVQRTVSVLQNAAG